MSLNIIERFAEQGSDKREKLQSKLFEELEKKGTKIREKIKLQAQLLGKQKNFISEAQLGAIISGISSDYRGLKPIIQSRLNSNAQGAAGKMEAQNYDDSINEAERESSDLEISIASDPDNSKTEPEPIPLGDIILLYLAPFIMVAEGFYEATAFSLIVGGLFAFPISLAFGLSKYLYMRRITTFMRKFESWKVQLAIAVISFIPMLVAFAGLGYLREIYLRKENIEVPNSILFFVLISSVLFLGAWMGEYIASGRRNDVRKRRKEIQDFKRIKEKRANSIKLKGEVKELKVKKTQSLSTRLITMDVSDSFFKKLKEDYEGTIAEFKSIYLLYRADRDNGVVPQYFNSIVIPEVVDFDDMSALYHSRNNHTKSNNYEN